MQTVKGRLKSTCAVGAGTVELDAHTAMLTLCVFLFISFPFGVATASTIRVGNLLGAGLGQQVSMRILFRVLASHLERHVLWRLPGRAMRPAVRC